MLTTCYLLLTTTFTSRFHRKVKLTLMISVIASSPPFQAKADELARRLELPQTHDADLFLVVGERLELREAHTKTGPVYVDFSSLKRKYGVGVRRRPVDMIAKAVGLRSTVLDATAGLGQDAFVLALYGCKVKMLERSLVIHALLEDGLQRALVDRDLADILGCMTLEHNDAKNALKTFSLESCPEVIYLDPMYPDLGKSAAKRKEMRLFRDLVGNDTDIEELFEIALKTASKRVVVKRPVKAPELAKPNFQLMGKTIRFDVYLC
jgi:16S rRNA (guanine1516-N2)-methyltransferase